jgi:hypothetical protein
LKHFLIQLKQILISNPVFYTLNILLEQRNSNLKIPQICFSMNDFQGKQYFAVIYWFQIRKMTFLFTFLVFLIKIPFETQLLLCFRLNLKTALSQKTKFILIKYQLLEVLVSILEIYSQHLFLIFSTNLIFLNHNKNILNQPHLPLNQISI